MAKQKPKTYLVPGFHSDVVWLEDQRDYARVLMGALEQNLRICRADSDYGFLVHELTYLKPYLDTHPRHRDLLRELVAAGRVGTGGSHSQPAETLIGGESLIRNILYGRLFHEQFLGDRGEVLMAWDIFGHVIQLPQILAKSRFAGCVWSKDIRGALPVFWGQALDGTLALFRRVPYWLDARDEEQALAFFRDAFEELRSFGFAADLRFDCVDFKPPSAWLAGRCGRLARGGHNVVVSGKGAERWFREAHERLREGKASAPVLARDFEWHHQGTALSRVNLKIANRLAENLVLNAERFATLASFLGAAYPDRALDKAWRQLLFNQHHDAITGTLCDRAYLDVMLGYREALEIGAEVLERSLDTLANIADTTALPARAVPLVVFNSLNWSRTEPVEATVEFERPVESFEVIGQDGRPVPFEVNALERRGEKIARAEVEFVAEDAPPLGYCIYGVVPSDKPLPERQKASGYEIENDFFKVVADPERGGGLSSIYDKLARRELVNSEAGPANELVALEENPNRQEPSWELYTVGPKILSRDHAATVSVEKGPISQRIVVHGEMTERRLETSFKRRHDVVLYRGVQRIYFRTRLDHYRGEHHLYVVTFPARLRGCQPVFETAFGSVAGRRSKGKLDFRTSQWRNYSDCAVRSTGNWLELGRSATLVAGSSRLAIGMVNLVISHEKGVVELANQLQATLVRKGVPVTPQYDDCDMPRRRNLPHEDATIPTPNNFNGDLKYGMGFRISLDAGGKNTYTAELLGRLAPRIRANYQAALKRDRHVVLFTLDDRMPDGYPPLPVLLISGRTIRDLRNAIRQLFARFDQNATIEISPTADVTGEPHRLDDYGIALLNRGNILASVENDNTIALFLMHTAAWGLSPWGKDRLPFFLVPEHKSHVFHYALYPHRGDWREAKTYRAGMEYNNPLIVRQAVRGKGELPPRHSFLELEGESLVLTALKPWGNPTAAFRSRNPEPARDGILVRWYEAEGNETRGTLRFFRPIEAAHWTNLLEEKAEDASLEDGTVAFSTGPFSIETLAFKPAPPERSPATGELGPSTEPLPVIHFRHWEHNCGAAPTGYSPLAISLAGRVETRVPISQGGVTINTLRLAIANNYADRQVSGKVVLHTPRGWHTVPDQVAFDLEPGAHKVVPVLLAFDDERRDGLVRARLEHEGQTYEDILTVGNPGWLEVALHRAGDSLHVALRNPTEEPLSGFVAIATPLESWPRRCVGQYCLGEVQPRQHPFALGPGEEKSLDFAIRVHDEEAYSRYDSIWAVVKVACSGRVEYFPVPGTPIRTDESGR